MRLQKRIMIIDDEQDIRDNLSYQFAAKGYDVTTALDGVDGVEKLRNVDPDLIILDLNMPKMGGIEFYQKICDKNGNPRYPILVLTARSNTKTFFDEFNIDGFIPKPFDIEQVIAEAAIIIEKKAREKLPEEEMAFIESRGVFFVDHDQSAFNKIGMMFLNAGYKVNSAKNGTRAIEKMMMDPPCLALINLGLMDLPGDIVIEKLLRMSKTSDIKFILYVSRNGLHDEAVMEKMSKKSGVISCMEYSDPKELLFAVDDAFKNHKVQNPGAENIKR